MVIWRDKLDSNYYNSQESWLIGRKDNKNETSYNVCFEVIKCVQEHFEGESNKALTSQDSVQLNKTKVP